MTDIQKEALKAEIKAKLCFTTPTISTADEWCVAVDKATDGIMEVIEKHDKEGAKG